jgi:hypothetical protein
MVYLAKHFAERRQVVTLLLVIFFFMFTATYIVYYVILIGVLSINVSAYVLFTSLLYFAVISLVGLVMLKIRELYLLPELIATIAIIHYFILDSANTLEADIVQDLSYVSTGQFIGQIWYIIIDSFNPGFLKNLSYFQTIYPFLNPLGTIIPDVPVFAMGIYIIIISAPTIILFFYISWKNRSGRSLGFALGLTLLEVNLVYGLDVVIKAAITIIATIIFALGVFGIIDRITKKEESQKIGSKTPKKPKTPT